MGLQHSRRARHRDRSARPRNRLRLRRRRPPPGDHPPRRPHRDRHHRRRRPNRPDHLRRRHHPRDRHLRPRPGRPPHRRGRPDSAAVSYTYDPLGNLTGIDADTDLSYTWDYAGHRTQVTNPAGSGTTTTSYDYDPAGRLHTADNDLLGETTYTYDAAGLVVRESLPDGQFRRWAHDPATGLVTRYRQLVDGQRLLTEFTYDTAGRIQTETTNGLTTTYAYDIAGQLAWVRTGDGGTGDDHHYTYDQVGNRLTDTTGHPGVLANPANTLSQTTFTYDDANQLATAATTGGDKNQTLDYDFDPEGRLTSAEATTGTTDELTIAYGPTGKPDQTTHTTPTGTETLTLAHDHDGLLIGVTGTGTGAADTQIGWDTSSAIAQPVTRTGANVDDMGFIYSPQGRIGAVDVTTGDTIEARDAHHNTITTPATTDTAYAAAYDPTGNPVGPTNTDTHGEILFGYQGELTTGPLLHLRNRDYTPRLARFTTTDPLDGINGTTTTANPYHYANNDPTNQTDPLGLRSLTDNAYAIPPAAVPTIACGNHVRATQTGSPSSPGTAATCLGSVGWYLGLLTVGVAGLAAISQFAPDHPGCPPASISAPQTSPGGTCSEHRGRIQVQGNVVPRAELSWRWSIPTPPTAAEGLAGLEGLWQQLPRGERRLLDQAFERARTFDQTLHSGRLPAAR